MADSKGKKSKAADDEGPLVKKARSMAKQPTQGPRADRGSSAIDCVLFLICTGSLASMPFRSHARIQTTPSPNQEIINTLRDLSWTWCDHEELDKLRDGFRSLLHARHQAAPKGVEDVEALLTEVFSHITSPEAATGVLTFCSKKECFEENYDYEPSTVLSIHHTAQHMSLHDVVTSYFKYDVEEEESTCKTCDAKLRSRRVLHYRAPQLLIVQGFHYSDELLAPHYSITVLASWVLLNAREELVYEIAGIIGLTQEEGLTDSTGDGEEWSCELYGHHREGGLPWVYHPVPRPGARNTSNVFTFKHMKPHMLALQQSDELLIVMRLLAQSDNEDSTT